MTNRNATIDIARGIGIILVVFGHNWIVLDRKDEIFRIIFSFHVPLFFFLSGLFLDRPDRISKFVRSRADTLVKPYLVVLMSIGVCKLIKIADQGYLFSYFVGIFYANGSTIVWVPLWFLSHLFLASVISKGIVCATVNLPNRVAWLSMTSSLLLSIGIYFIDNLQANSTDITAWYRYGLPLSFDLAPISMAFILGGFLLKERVKSMNFNWLGFLLAVSIFTSLHYFSDETLNLNVRLYGNPLISSVLAVTGIYLVLSAASFFQKFAILRRSLTYIGSSSLFILIFHGYVQEKVFLILLRFSQNHYANGIVAFAIGVLLPLTFLEITKRQKYLELLLLPSKFQPTR